MRRVTVWSIGLVVFALVAISAWMSFSAHRDGQPPSAVGDVLFATTRAMNPASGPHDRFDGRRGSLRYGRCSVGYRPIPLSENLADSVNFFVPTAFQQIQSVQLLPGADFNAALAEGPDRPVVLFVHGYSYGFDKTCRMGAELQRIMGEGATVVMFSWPSDANPADYVADQVDIEWSVPVLADLIDRLRRVGGVSRLRLLAHSLGTRGVLFALDALQLDGAEPPFAGHLVLLAPDFDTASFRQRFDRIRRQASRVTLYASDNDTPLRVSQALHGQPRLGQAGEHLTLIDGMTTIDVSRLGRYRPSGHEYFFYHPIAADDLVEALVRGRPPDQRKHTRPRSRNGDRYWVLVETPARTR